MGETSLLWRERLKAALRNPWIERIICFIVAPALLLCSLWLPPVSLGVRVFHLDCPQITPKGGTVGQEGSAQLTVPADALGASVRLRLTQVSPEDKRAMTAAEAEALKALPGQVELQGPLTRLELYGTQPKEAVYTVPLPEAADPDLLDVYAWTGKAWQWVPSQAAVDAGEIRASLAAVPKLLATVQTRPQGVAVGVAAPDVAAINAAPLDLASELYIAGLSLMENGSVQGQIALDSAPGNILVLPTLSNLAKGVARSDWVANLIANPEPRAAHVKAIVEAVSKGGYRGLSLEYEALDEDLRDEFASFVSELAARLHQDGKLLAVRVDEPRLAADGSWQTGGYDWARLGEAADLLRIPMASDPTAYDGGGAMEKLLRATTDQVNRDKIQLIVSAACYEQIGAERRPLCYGDALSLASQAVVADGGNTTVLPGQVLSVQLPHLASGLQEHPSSGHVWFAFKDSAGVEHKVWLENASSVTTKLTLAKRFGVRSVSIDELAGTANDASIWNAVRLARTPTGRGQSESRYKVVWQVRSAEGQVVQQGTSPADRPAIAWTAVDRPGDYLLTVAITEDDGKTTVGQPGTLPVRVPTPTPSPTPTSTPTPKPTATPQPTSRPQPQVAQAPSGGVGFGYGIQVDMVTDHNYDRILNHVQAIGFGWIKQQVEWKLWNPAPGVYDWGRLDAIVNAASSRGIKVMFSVCKAPNWARPNGDDRSVEGPPADYGTYAEFMRQMAARYKGRVQAYEIWNEQNLWYEWGGRGNRLSAAAYVQLLGAAYRAIKSVDPGATVISGALTPTGWSDGDTAIDDQVYLRQMYDAGLKNVCDAVGAHPSGFNNPPDADWRTYRDPANSFQAVGHPSWFFRATMEGYRNIMVAYGDGWKRIWPTEFGWASVDGLGVPPARGYEYAADNTAQEQAQYIVRAYQMGKNWGFVGTMFLWNLNFAPVSGPRDEKAAFGIVDAGWGARPAFHALAGMPK